MSSHSTFTSCSSKQRSDHRNVAESTQDNSLSVTIDLADHQTTPTHWMNKKGKGFRNPWPSWRDYSYFDYANLALDSMDMPAPLKSQNLVPVRQPTWGVKSPNSIRATWLGHACFFVELPQKQSGARGGRVLFDPVFSDRCSPSQSMGPRRFTDPPCKIEDIPEVDAIVISHDHYDHLDTHTITKLFKQPRRPHIFAPLGNESYFASLGLPKSHFHTLDWWQKASITDKSSGMSFELTCSPAQHMSGRTLLDNFKTLWSSWVLTDASSKVFFGGDTGYKNVRKGEDEDTAPVCPAFKEIGSRFGQFDLALLPIGAYNPRWFMSTAHASPEDSVRIFQDINAKKALGMHWGTWVLTNEEVTEPPRLLAEACRKHGVRKGAFDVCDIGETRTF